MNVAPLAVVKCMCTVFFPELPERGAIVDTTSTVFPATFSTVQAGPSVVLASKSSQNTALQVPLPPPPAPAPPAVPPALPPEPTAPLPPRPEPPAPNPPVPELSPPVPGPAPPVLVSPPAPVRLPPRPVVEISPPAPVRLPPKPVEPPLEPVVAADPPPPVVPPDACPLPPVPVAFVPLLAQAPSAQNAIPRASFRPKPHDSLIIIMKPPGCLLERAATIYDSTCAVKSALSHSERFTM